MARQVKMRSDGGTLARLHLRHLGDEGRSLAMVVPRNHGTQLVHRIREAAHIITTLFLVMLACEKSENCEYRS